MSSQTLARYWHEAHMLDVSAQLPPLAGGAPTTQTGGSALGPTIATGAGVNPLDLQPVSVLGAPGNNQIPVFNAATGSWESKGAVPAEPTGAAGGSLAGAYPNPTLALGAAGPVIATQIAGVDPTGGVDSTAGLLKAVEEVVSKNQALYVQAGTYKIGTAGTGVDLSTVKYGASEFISALEIYCAAGAFFEGKAGLKAPVVRVAPSAGKQFISCNMVWGKIQSGGKESHCVEVTAGYNDGFLKIGTAQGVSEAERGTMVGVLFKVVGLEQFVGNNLIELGIASTCGFGIATEGNKAGEAGKENFQMSGNQVRFGEIIKCLHDGVNIDTNGIGRTTELNCFYGGDIEACSGAGIRDNNGNNSYFVWSTNTNTERGFVLTTGAVAANKQKRAPYVRGRFVDKCTLNGQLCDLVNSVAATGEVTAPEGGKPVTGTEYENTFERPIEATLFINEAKKIVKWFKSGAQQGEVEVIAEVVTTPVIRVAPGEKLRLTFVNAGTVAWNWFAVI